MTAYLYETRLGAHVKGQRDARSASVVALDVATLWAKQGTHLPVDLIVRPRHGPFAAERFTLLKAGVVETVRCCRVCGCAEHDACVLDDTPCTWLGEDLCSACAGRAGK